MTIRFRLCLACLLVAGCAASPSSRYFTLSGAGSPRAPQTATAPSVLIGPVAIPAVVDRPEIVVTINDNEVWLDEFNRWASPLADAIALSTAEHVGAALGSPRVALASQAASVDADFSVAIEVQRFDSVPGSYALVDAIYRVRRSADGRTASGRTTDRQAVTDKSYDALAAAHSRAVARLSRDITDALRGLSAQPSGAVPSPVGLPGIGAKTSR